MKKLLELGFVILFFTTSIFAQDHDDLLREEIPCEDIEIGCLILGRDLGGEHIIRNNTEYQKLMDFPSPHHDCGNYQLPLIDFNKYTLLGYVSGTGGCAAPIISHTVRKQNNNRIIDIFITQQGGCKMLNSFTVWCLIPKIDENSNVNFNIIKKVKLLDKGEIQNHTK
jgi:hypothetical protein